MTLNCYIYLPGADYPFTKDFILSLTLCVVLLVMPSTPRAGPFPVIPFILVSFFDVLECNGDSRSSTLSVPFYLHFILSLVLLTSCLSLLNHFAAIAITSHGLFVTLQFTKAIQFGGRHLHIPLLAVVPCFSLFTHDSFSSRTPFLSRFSHFRSQGPRSAYKT